MEEEEEDDDDEDNEDDEQEEEGMFLNHYSYCLFFDLEFSNYLR